MADLSDHPADRAANPVVGISWDDPGPRDISTHSHRRGQVIYAERGCVTVEAHGATFILPPHRAAWVPPETPHAARYPREVAFRGVFIAADLCGALPARCTIIQVDPLTRELIRTAAGMPWDYAPDGRHARLMRVLIDQLVAMPTAPLTLPDGRDARVRTIMRGLHANPGDEQPLSHWAAVAGMSERTLARRFLADTGMSFRAWRQQLRLVVALERLAAGDPVTTVSIDLGYRTPSSFSTMFRKALGVPPSAYFDGAVRAAAAVDEASG